jgi:hypothetical protein
VFINAYDSVAEARRGIGAWLTFYNDERVHQALDYRTPHQAYLGAVVCGRCSCGAAWTTLRVAHISTSEEFVVIAVGDSKNGRFIVLPMRRGGWELKDTKSGQTTPSGPFAQPLSASARRSLKARPDGRTMFNHPFARVRRIRLRN